MSKLQKLAALILMITSLPCFAAEIVILRNGFSIRCERRETIGPVTRLYPSGAATNFIDVPSDQIDRFEQDPLFSPVQATVPPRTQSVNAAVNSMERQQFFNPNLAKSVPRCSGRRLANDPPECQRSRAHRPGVGARPRRQSRVQKQ